MSHHSPKVGLPPTAPFRGVAHPFRWSVLQLSSARLRGHAEVCKLTSLAV